MSNSHKKGNKQNVKKERLVNDKNLERNVSNEIAREFLENNKNNK